MSITVIDKGTPGNDAKPMDNSFLRLDMYLYQPPQLLIDSIKPNVETLIKSP